MTDWTPQEQEALRGLPREAAPPETLEHRVLSQLRAERLVSRTRMRWAIAAMLTVAMFGAGFLTGRMSPPAPAASGPRFLLLLRESPEQLSGEALERQIAEYSSWAQAEGQSGVLIGGEKLQDGGRLVSQAATEDQAFNRGGEIGGFFMIQAADLETATKIARSSPHIRYGGVVELRPIHDIDMRE